MTARDAARSRHPSSGGPGVSPPGATGSRLPTVVAAVLLSALLPVLADVLPLAVLICAVWTASAFLLMAAWCALCEVVQARRFNRHVEQALRVVQRP